MTKVKEGSIVKWVKVNLIIKYSLFVTLVAVRPYVKSLYLMNCES